MFDALDSDQSGTVPRGQIEQMMQQMMPKEQLGDVLDGVPEGNLTFEDFYLAFRDLHVDDEPGGGRDSKQASAPQTPAATTPGATTPASVTPASTPAKRRSIFRRASREDKRRWSGMGAASLREEDELRAEFKKYSTNGKLKAAGFDMFMHEFNPQASEAGIEAAFLRLDPDQRGYITVEAFIQAFRTTAPASPTPRDSLVPVRPPTPVGELDRKGITRATDPDTVVAAGTGEWGAPITPSFRDRSDTRDTRRDSLTAGAKAAAEEARANLPASGSARQERRDWIRQVADLEDKLAEMEGNEVEYKQSIAALQKRCESLEDSVKAQAQRSREDREADQAAFSHDIKKRVATFEAEKAQLLARIRRATEGNLDDQQKSEAALAASRAEAKGLRSQIKALESRIAECDAQVENLSTALNAARADGESKHRKLLMERSRSEELMAQIDSPSPKRNNLTENSILQSSSLLDDLNQSGFLSRDGDDAEVGSAGADMFTAAEIDDLRSQLKEQTDRVKLLEKKMSGKATPVVEGPSAAGSAEEEKKAREVYEKQLLEAKAKFNQEVRGLQDKLEKLQADLSRSKKETASATKASNETSMVPSVGPSVEDLKAQARVALASGDKSKSFEALQRENRQLKKLIEAVMAAESKNNQNDTNVQCRSCVVS